MDNSQDIVTNLDEALRILNISDYKERILNSNSHGELFHVYQYIELAQIFKHVPHNFRDWFVAVVSFAEKEWQRPESVFQHITTLLNHALSKK